MKQFTLNVAGEKVFHWVMFESSKLRMANKDDHESDAVLGNYQITQVIHFPLKMKF